MNTDLVLLFCFVIFAVLCVTIFITFGIMPLKDLNNDKSLSKGK